MNSNSRFDAAAACKKLLREARTGALATLMPSSGDPYCSLVNVASAADGAPLLLLSKLALHTQNILADSRVSLMLDEGRSGDPLEGARVMLMGRAAATDDADARRRYLARHPQADLFASFGDFAFYRVTLKAAHLVAGFARIVDFGASDILTDLSGSQVLVSNEAEIVTHINDEHSNALRLYATKLLHGPDGAWRCVGCDPEGLELQLDGIAFRLVFPHRIKSLGPLREILQDLAQTARSA
jgi:heme oxygenase (biliverdin-IX-beta and delta-forming)